MNKLVKIVIAGPRGKMGHEAVKMVMNTPQFKLVGVVDNKNNGLHLKELHPLFSDTDCLVYTNIAQCFAETAPDVFIDLTVPKAAYEHAKVALSHGVRPVVGTTGMTNEELNDLQDIANEKKLGCIIAPNFAVGAVLMMKFAQMAAKFFQDVEIIEKHHDQKLDAPSGTAIKTAEMIEKNRTYKNQGHPDEKETIPGARGATFSGMHIHSVRLPGLIAHQEVIFGSTGETLTIRHDSYDRASFMSGIKISVETILHLDSFVYGLENILE